MKITAALKQYLLAKGWIKADDTDAAIGQVVTVKLLAGELTVDTLNKLTSEQPADGARTVIQGIVTDALNPILTQMKQFQDTLAAMQAGGGTGTKAADATTTTPAAPPAPAKAEPGDLEKQFNAWLGKSPLGQLIQQAGGGAIAGEGGSISPTKLLGRAAQSGWLYGPDANVKKAIDAYDQTRSAVHWPMDHKHPHLRGRRATTPGRGGPGTGRALDTTSRADEAIIGASFKWLLNCNSNGDGIPPGLRRLSDHDMELVKYALHELPWTGAFGGENGDGYEGKLTDLHRKAILDDSTSGGIYAAPLVLDDAIIQQPILYGELFPLVEVINLNQGRRIEAFTFGRPTFTSGIAEGTAIPLFDTTNFIGALDTTIQNAVGGMEIGNDFEEDSPANIGAMVVQSYGEAALQWLDMVVAVGDGTTQPKGIFNTAGLTVVGSANGAAGPLTVGDLEGLMFGVNKAYRTSRGGRNVYIGNETSYRRFRGIPTGTAYNTRVFGMNYGDYETLGFPYKIHPSVPNNKIAFVNMAYYRMYRRLGTNVKVERGGQDLVKRNVTLIVVRMRYGGQLTQGGAAAIMTDAQT